jgi:Flp pilus assembly pilin Flp
MRAFGRVLVDDGGAALVEYSLLLAGITLSALVALNAIGNSLQQLFANTTSSYDHWATSGQ